MTTSGVRPASIHVNDGRIAAISEWADVRGKASLTDAGHLVVMPSVVDTHVHVNDPGRAEWEGFETATRAAAAGGVGTLLDMPLNSIPATTSVAALEAKHRAAEGRCWVDVGMIGGVVPGNARELAALHAAGVKAFKCFLTPSGVDEFPAVTGHDLDIAMPILASAGATLMVHAEDPALLMPAHGSDPRRYSGYLATRPDVAEVSAVEMIVRLAARHGTTVHIVHLSSPQSLAVLRAARAAGVRVTAETCPHYLTFAAEEIADGATELKCAPPIRDRAAREALWSALEFGDIGMIVSDHSPCPPAMKCRETGDFHAAWGGISSLQLGLAIVWRGAMQRGITMERIAEWMCAAPARLAGLDARKGSIAPGFDADLTIWDPDAEFTVNSAALEHRHPLTPYLGQTLRGVVHSTFVRGREAYAHGRCAESPSGRVLS